MYDNINGENEENTTQNGSNTSQSTQGNTYRYVGNKITQDNIDSRRSTDSGSTSYSTGTNTSYGQTTAGSADTSGTGRSNTSDYSRFYTNNNTYGNTSSGSTSSAGEGSSSGKKQKKTGSGSFKFYGRTVAAALIFGLVASLMFTGVNSILGITAGGGENKVQTANSGGSDDSSIATVASKSDESADATTASSTSTTTSGTASDVSDVAANVMPSIVSVTSIYTATDMFGQQAQGEAAGSGIIVAQTDSTLYIVTNNHVVEDASSVSITFVDDSEVEAEIKGTDSTNDLAVLSVSISDISSDTMSQIKVATLGDSEKLEVGEAAIVVGNSMGYGQSVTIGIISALNREVTIDNVTSSLIQTDAAINPGNSGGALLNAAGEDVGISSAKYADTEVEGMCYAIPISTAIPIINQLIERQTVSADKEAYLGITGGMDISSETAQLYNMPEGVYVSQVSSGTAAEEAGIQVKDIITYFDGQAISTMEQLQELMQYYEAGTTVDIVIQRPTQNGYEEKTLSVTLGSKNASTSM